VPTTTNFIATNGLPGKDGKTTTVEQLVLTTTARRSEIMQMRIGNSQAHCSTTLDLRHDG